MGIFSGLLEKKAMAMVCLSRIFIGLTAALILGTKIQQISPYSKHTCFPKSPAPNDSKWPPAHMVAAANYSQDLVWFPIISRDGVPIGVHLTCH